MRPFAIAVIVFAAYAVLPACIEFDQQTIMVRYDAEKDVLRARLVYQGIHSGGDDLAADLAALQKVADRGSRFFLLDNWPLDCDLSRREKGEKDTPLAALFRPHTTVTNGSFFIDDEGRLSAWQDIEIRNVTKVLTSCNQLINLAVMTGKGDLLDEADEKTVELCRALAQEGHQWITLDADGLHLSFSASREDVVKMKRRLLDSIVEQARSGRSGDGAAVTVDPEIPDMTPEAPEPGDDEGEDGEDEVEEDGAVDELETMLRFIARNDFSWSHRGHRVRATLAPDETGVIRLRHWNETRYEPNLLEPAEGATEAPKLPAKIDRNVKLEMLLDL